MSDGQIEFSKSEVVDLLYRDGGGFVTASEVVDLLQGEKSERRPVDALEGLLPLDDQFDARSITRGSKPRPRRKPESEIVLEGINYLRSLPQGYARKVHGGAMGNAGEPDVDACVRGRAVKLEAKAGSNKPSKIQMAALRRWAATGALVGWFTGTQHIVDLLDHLEDQDYVTDLSAPGCAQPCHREAA